jgi:16S rRNA processing protein RimM
MSENYSRKSQPAQLRQMNSNEPGEIEFIAVGQLRRPHGVRGEILMAVWTEFPERLKPGVRVFVGDDHQPVHIQSVREHGDGLLLAFEEYIQREAVGFLRNQVVMVRADDLPPLEDGEVYIHQLLGMTVLEEGSNRLLGTLVEVLETGANDVYIVKDQLGAETLLPAIDSVIVEIDLPNRQMRVHLLPGLTSR